MGAGAYFCLDDAVDGGDPCVCCLVSARCFCWGVVLITSLKRGRSADGGPLKWKGGFYTVFLTASLTITELLLFYFLKCV